MSSTSFPEAISHYLLFRKLCVEGDFGKYGFTEILYFQWLVELKELPYTEYLQTTHWENFRKRAREYFKNKCQLCGTDRNNHVHHKHYNALGQETFDDVILLCNECHEKQHGIRE